MLSLNSMRNKLLILLAAMLVLASCDKVKQTQKHLDGDWTILEYEFIDHNGLHYFYPVEGTMTFGNSTDNFCDYSLDMDYTYSGASTPKVESGRMEFQDGEYFVMHRESPTVGLIQYARVVVITNDDLKIIFTDEAGAHELILEK